jgi:hypothetical protein
MPKSPSSPSYNNNSDPTLRIARTSRPIVPPRKITYFSASLQTPISIPPSPLPPHIGPNIEPLKPRTLAVLKQEEAPRALIRFPPTPPPLLREIRRPAIPFPLREQRDGRFVRARGVFQGWVDEWSVIFSVVSVIS